MSKKLCEGGGSHICTEQGLTGFQSGPNYAVILYVTLRVLPVRASVPRCVCHALHLNAKITRRRKGKIGVNVYQVRSDRCAYFQFKKVKVKVTGRQKHLQK